MGLRPLHSTAKLKYLIAGSRAGGTAFIASYLSNRGYPCGHERFCDDPGKGIMTTDEDLNPVSEMLLADSSLIHLEQFDRKSFKHLPIIMLARNPYHVLSSQIRVEMLHGNVISPDALMSYHVSAFERLEASGRVVMICRVEYDLNALCVFLGIPYATPEPTIKRNEHNFGRICLGHADLDRYENAPKLKAFAERFRYSFKNP